MSVRGCAMDVVYVVGQLSIGGTERQLLALVQHLDRTLFRPRVVCLSGHDDLAQSFRAANCPVYVIHSERVGRVRTLWRLITFLRQEEPVIVQAFSYAWYYAIVAAIFAKVPHVLVGERNVILWKKWWHILMDRVLLWKATYAIVNAKAIRHQMITDQHMPINRVRIIYNGLDLRRFDQISGWGFSGLSMNPALANAGHLVVCAVASLSVRKRIDLLLRAHALVLAEVPNVDLWLIGDGPLRSQLESLTQELEIRHSVTFWGIRHDVPAILKHATVGALSSQVEGLSNAIMEYMAARLPVVATNVGGNLELVLHGETGLLVPPNDPQALADAIVYLLRNPEGARRFGEAGRRRVEEHFTVERMVRETEAVYEELLSQNGH